MRHRQRHLHQTIFTKVRDHLTTLGWLADPAPFGGTPATVIDFEPQAAGVTPARNTVAISMGDEAPEEEYELGGMMTTRFAVFVDIYPDSEAVGVSIAADVKDYLTDIYTPLLDFTAAPPAASTEYVEFEHVMIELFPTSASQLDKRSWRSVKATAVVYFSKAPLAAENPAIPTFRHVALGESIEHVSGEDVRISGSGVYTQDSAGPTVVVLVDGMEYGTSYAADPTGSESLTAVLVITTNDESTLPLSTLPVGAMVFVAGDQPILESAVTAQIATYASYGITAVDAGLGVAFPVESEPFTISEADGDPVFRSAALGEEIAYDSDQDPRLGGEGISLSIDPEGSWTFVHLPIVEGVDYVDPPDEGELTSEIEGLLVITANDESVIPGQDYVGTYARVNIELHPISFEQIDLIIAAYAESGLTCELVGVGVFFDVTHTPFTVTEVEGDAMPSFAVGEPITDGLALSTTNEQWWVEDTGTPTDHFALISDLVDGTEYETSTGLDSALTLSGLVRVTANDETVLAGMFPVGSYLIGDVSTFGGTGTATFNESAFTDQLAGFDGTGVTYELIGYGVRWQALGDVTLPFTISEAGGEIPSFAVGDSITESGKFANELDPTESINWWVPDEAGSVNIVLLADAADGTYECSAGAVAIDLVGLFRITGNDGSVVPDAYPPGAYQAIGGDGHSFSTGPVTINQAAFESELAAQGFEGAGLTYEVVGWALRWDGGSLDPIPFTITEA